MGMSGLFQHDPAKLREELAGEVPPTSSGCLGGCLGIVLLGTGLAFALRGAYRLLIATFTTVQTDPKGWVALILITAAIVAAGAVLYYVKVKLHTGYGLMETTFG